MSAVLLFAFVLVPIISGLMQVLKSSVNLPKNFLPLIALVVGLIVGFLAYPFTDFDYDLRLWAGLFAGMSSVGAYELVNKRTGTTKE